MTRFPLILFMVTIAVAEVAAPCSAAEGMVWGSPVAGLRVGVQCGETTLFPHQQPHFVVTLQNVSGHRLILPAMAAYMNRQHPWMTHYRAQPLSPEVTGSEGLVRSSVRESGGADLRKVAKGLVELPAGQSLKVSLSSLEEGSYDPDAGKIYMGGAMRDVWWLRAPGVYHIRYCFENEEGMVNGKRVWVGKAFTGPVTLRVVPLPAAYFRVDGGFTVPKTDYFVGEPIKITFLVKNSGAKLIRFEDGGDFGQLERNERFSFSAVDETGRPVPLVDAPPYMGGPVGSRQLAHGDSFSKTLLANAWLLFSEPGKYTITCKRTLNMDMPIREYAPEESLPAVPIETKLTVTLRKDDGALLNYFNHLLIGSKVLYSPEQTEMQALMQAHPDALFEPIRQMLLKPGPNQSAAASLISSYGPSKAMAPMVEAARTGSHEVRMGVMFYLAQWKAPEAGPLLVEALSSGDIQEREVALLQCTKTPYPEYLPALLRLEHDADPTVRRILAEALGEYKDPRVTPVLLRMLHDPDPTVEVPLSAALSLGKPGNQESIPVLISLLQSKRGGQHPGFIYAALQTLTGKRLPQDPRVWRKWWNESRGNG